MQNPLSRRGFLGAGASIATATLVGLPRVATAETSAAELRAKIIALLDRPNPELYGVRPGPVYPVGCSCSDCRRLREGWFVCSLCDFSGIPIVAACECRETRASNLEFCQTRIRAIKAGRTADAGGYSLEQLREMLAEDRARPDTICEAHRPRCSHGTAHCPTCGDDGTGGGPPDGDAFIPIIRELRALVVAGGAR